MYSQEVMMKTCTICSKTREIDQFDRRKLSSGKSVPTGRCKPCRRAYMKEYYSKKSGSTGLTREEWLNSVRKPELSPEQRAELGKQKWEAWYAEWKDSGVIEERRKEAEQEREAKLATGVRVCSSCKEELPLSQFHMRTRKRKDGTSYKVPYAYCKTCKNNIEYVRRASPEGKAVAIAYRKSPAGILSARRDRALRKRRRKEATPKWLTTEQRKQIVATYEHMRDCKIVTGEDYHVDHIIPLRGENVCGLHVPWNLQVLPADVNMDKSNKYYDDWEC